MNVFRILAPLLRNTLLHNVHPVSNANIGSSMWFNGRSDFYPEDESLVFFVVFLKNVTAIFVIILLPNLKEWHGTIMVWYLIPNAVEDTHAA